MSALAIGAALGILVCWVSAGPRPRQEPYNKKPPAPQPRTAEEARRWRADWEARR